MASLLDILPIVTILTMGAGVWWAIGRFQSLEYRKTELFNIFLLLGVFILLFPLTLIGIQPSGVLSLGIGEKTLNIIDFRGYCMIYFLLGLILAIVGCYYFLRKILALLTDYDFDLNKIRDYRLCLIIFLLLDYLILELILPLRGFDAFYYYLSEAEVFYQAGRITEVNYLSFLPVVKSPLNVLLYVYSYYITGDLSIHLIPFIFLLGIVFLIYDFSIELFNDRNIGLIAAVFTLTLPFTYWLMNYWAFYQDLYLCYFFSVTCYFSLKWYKHPLKIYFGLFMGIGIIISLLTKITAWVLPLILVLWLPTGNKSKKLRLLLLPLLGCFLCVQVSTKIYIGIIIPTVISLVMVSYLIFKEEETSKLFEEIGRITAITVSLAVGSIWLINRINLSPLVWNEIYSLYFQVKQSIVLSYPTQPKDPLLYTLETVHRTNLISAVGILLLGTVFVLPWIILKIFALINMRPIMPPLIWLFVFFGVWLTYYLNGSVRYLAPIIIPMILCISWGFYQLTSKINDRKTREVLAVLFPLLGCLSFYYLIPLESLLITDKTQEKIGLSYNQAALDYYSHPEILIIIAIALSLLSYFIFRKNFFETSRSNSNLFRFHWLRKGFFCGIIIIPLVVQSYLLLYVHGDFRQFHAIHEYEYRDEYQELVTVLKQQNQPLTAILTVRTPGLQFFTKQPVIDIYYQHHLFKENIFFPGENSTATIAFLQNPIGNFPLAYDFEYDISIRFVVVPSSNNLYYENYITQIKDRSFFFQTLENNSIVIHLFDNSDFILYEVLI